MSVRDSEVKIVLKNTEEYDDLFISGEILNKIEEAKKSLFAVRWRIYSSNIDSEEQKDLAVRLINVADLLSSVQQQYTSDEMYRYLGYTK